MRGEESPVETMDSVHMSVGCSYAAQRSAVIGSRPHSVFSAATRDWLSQEAQPFRSAGLS